MILNKYNKSQSNISVEKYLFKLSQLHAQFSRLDQQFLLSFPKFQWNKSFNDHRIRDDRDFENHYKYAINNHIKHKSNGYPENYKYTSLNYPGLVDDW